MIEVDDACDAAWCSTNITCGCCCSNRRAEVVATAVESGTLHCRKLPSPFAMDPLHCCCWALLMLKPRFEAADKM